MRSSEIGIVPARPGCTLIEYIPYDCRRDTREVEVVGPITGWYWPCGWDVDGEGQDWNFPATAQGKVKDYAWEFSGIRFPDGSFECCLGGPAGETEAEWIAKLDADFATSLANEALDCAAKGVRNPSRREWEA
ncbi:MAG: hypothetical protein IPN24_18430 [Betaproteobacteria bacterium]|nr:hypothetical protein [Betaproteobacteria bacterium]